MANPDWASFPPDLLLLILKNLPSPTDFVSFHCVCKGWRSAARQSDGSSLLPLLLDQHVFHDTRRLHFYSPFSIESRSIRIPQVGTKWVAGLSQGYLIAFDKVDFSLSLFNPFTWHSISLPPLAIEPFKLSSFRPYLLQNREMVVISHLDQRVLKLGCCKVGDQEWSFVSCKVGANGGGNVYYQGIYYVNDSAEGPTMVIDPATSDVLFTISAPEERIPHLNSWKNSKGFDYLVESRMGLLRIFRPYDVFESFKNCNFDIHQLVNKDGSFRWVKVGNIDDSIVFLDKFNGICASTDGVGRMRGNCIYFTKYRLDGIYGWRGILCRYDIASGDTVALPHCLETRGSWFVPSLATIPD
ncbi:F-box protein SKIP23-like [Carex rostrata]